MKNKKRLFTTNEVDDNMFRSSDLHIQKTFKDGLEFILETQSGENIFTLYHDGVIELNNFLTKWVNENRT